MRAKKSWNCQPHSRRVSWKIFNRTVEYILFEEVLGSKKLEYSKSWLEKIFLQHFMISSKIVNRFFLFVDWNLHTCSSWEKSNFRKFVPISFELLCNLQKNHGRGKFAMKKPKFEKNAMGQGFGSSERKHKKVKNGENMNIPQLLFLNFLWLNCGFYQIVIKYRKVKFSKSTKNSWNLNYLTILNFLKIRMDQRIFKKKSLSKSVKKLIFRK